MRTHPYGGQHLICAVLGALFTLSQPFAADLSLAQRPSPPDYRFEFLTGEDQDSEVRDINNAGTAVGTISAPGKYWGQEVLWPLSGTPVPLQGFGAKATALNNGGQPTGYWQTSGQELAVTWSKEQIQPLPLDGNMGADALGINVSGTVVGSLVKPNEDFVPAKWADGRAQPLPVPKGATGRALDINDWCQIVGEVRLNPSGVNHAYLWTSHQTIDLHPSDFDSSTAWAINAIGQIAGWAVRDGASHAGIWNGRHFTDLNRYAFRSVAYDINIWGLVVGDASLTPGSGNTAVLWNLRHGKEAIDLNIYLPPEAVRAGWHLQWAVAINDAGVIVGAAHQPSTSRTRGFRLIPTRPVDWGKIPLAPKPDDDPP